MILAPVEVAESTRNAALEKRRLTGKFVESHPRNPRLDGSERAIAAGNSRHCQLGH